MFLMARTDISSSRCNGDRCLCGVDAIASPAQGAKGVYGVASHEAERQGPKGVAPCGGSGGMLTRLRARTPEPALHRPANIAAISLVSGHPELPAKGEIESSLEAIVRLLSVMRGGGSRRRHER